MKALVYLGPRRMELQDLPEPSPAPGEVRVRMRASAICGSDLHGFREASPRRVPPLVMGHEAVGDIDAVGDEVDPSVVGSRVVAMPLVPCGTCPRCLEGRSNLCPQRRLMGMSFPGAFAEAFSIPANQVVAMPESLADERGALVEPLANAVHAVARSVGAGDDVLVIGAGAIGLFAARTALLDGARRAFVVDKLPSRLRLAAGLGAGTAPARGSAGRSRRGDIGGRCRRRDRCRRAGLHVAARPRGGALRRQDRSRRAGLVGGAAGVSDADLERSEHHGLVRMPACGLRARLSAARFRRYRRGAVDHAEAAERGAGGIRSPRRWRRLHEGGARALRRGPERGGST